MGRHKKIINKLEKPKRIYKFLVNLVYWISMGFVWVAIITGLGLFLRMIVGLRGYFLIGLTCFLFIFIIFLYVILKSLLKKVKLFNPKIEPEKLNLTSKENEIIEDCPLCHSKIIKGKVLLENGVYSQVIKCSNINCVFAKILTFEV
jgi:hypothetical protein